MATIRRILKYTPAVVLGSLVVAWFVAYSYWFGAALLIRGNIYKVLLEHGSVHVSTYNERIPPVEKSGFFYERAESHTGNRMGRLAGGYRKTVNSSRPPPHTIFTGVVVPFVLLITVALPVAIGPIIHFRFRLWHYLAYTALMAVELAYYLRWQE